MEDRYDDYGREKPSGLLLDTSNETLKAPYYVKQTPRGSVVFCRAHKLLTDELKTSEALALRDALNLEHKKRMAL